MGSIGFGYVTRLSQALVVEQANTFIDKLASTGENVLLNFDNFLTVDDIIKGRK